MRYLDGRARGVRFLLAAQQTKGASMRFRIAHVVVLVVALFNDRRRLLHDMLVGTIVINNPARAEGLRRNRWNG